MKKKPDFSIFYSLEFLNLHRESAANHPDWGKFISTDRNPQEFSSEYDHLQNNNYSKRIDFTPYRKKHPLFDAIIDKVGAEQPENYYRCSGKYYADCFDVLTQLKGKINRIVEVGPHHGDLSCFFAGSLEAMDATLDLVDIYPKNLLRTYDKIKTLFPETAPKVRLFFGDLVLYIKQVSSKSPYINLIHYQGSYNFNDVVRDLGATYYAKDKIAGTMIHNTHLRSTDMCSYAFTDVALYALFGAGVQFLKLGEEASIETELNPPHQSTTYLAGSRVDGMYLPYNHNHFCYPHPDTPLEAFFEKNEITVANAQ